MDSSSRKRSRTQRTSISWQGKKHNTLRSRVDHHDFAVEQLLMGVLLLAGPESHPDILKEQFSFGVVSNREHLEKIPSLTKPRRNRRMLSFATPKVILLSVFVFLFPSIFMCYACFAAAWLGVAALHAALALPVRGCNRLPARTESNPALE